MASLREKIKNIEVEYRGYEMDRASVSCEYDGARFHIWVSAKLKPQDFKLYKNAPEGCPEAEDFDTRTLDQRVGIGAKLVPIMLEEAVKLAPAAKAMAEMAELRRLAFAEDEWREHLKEKAGPALYAAARLAMEVILARDPQGLGAHYQALSAAIKLAEPPKKEAA